MQKFQKKDFGGVLVELAISSGVLLVSIFGVFDFSSYLNEKIKYENILYESSEIIRNYDTSPDDIDVIFEIESNAIQILDENLSTHGLDSNNYSKIAKIFSYTLPNSTDNQKIGFLWLGLKSNENSKILNFLSLKKCTKILLPISLTFGEENIPQADLDFYNESPDDENYYQQAELFSLQDGYLSEDLSLTIYNFCD